jgi:hypothetical protein
MASASSIARREKSLFPAALFPFCAGVPAIGVGHIRIASFSVTPAWCLLSGLLRLLVAFLAPLLSVTQAVGHDEEPLPPVREAKLLRAEQSDRNAATQSFQCRDEHAKLSVRIPRDVLAEETTSPAGIEGVNDAIEEPAVVIGAEAASGDAVGLAGVARHDAIHCATPCSSVEGGKVRPDRRRMEPPVFHARDHDAGSRDFPLHVADGASLWLGKSDAEVESADTCAEGEATPGM